ncbi:DUF4167 domain-containing protein [Acidiphilium sp. AL]|uniref:DUF4167 domain-containing protein n=1 Tax=Acidiphilium iwatense TaxID=768198 RepID=A0ABS9DUT3_9PROT|nr:MULTISPECIES: DUF4167 domain-containing protein [Acidiphilium]MCF3946489.1 DUF4167 domain-containing protein [Acidiphilium iwatense]MCU4158659.1 DUF4167 domain-containing protein [Acidiphilium sp. AL]
MNIKRMRGRNNRGGGGNFRNFQSGAPLNRNHVFDSNGPEQRVRGTAQQLFDKYQQMGRDASSGGDRVLAESYFQYAEHYFRIITAMNQAQGVHGGQHGGHAQGQNGHINGRRETAEDQNDGDFPAAAAGIGDQPPIEPREIPISAVPPEA